MSSIVAIIPAAGVGSRMLSDRPKQYLSLGPDGAPMLAVTVRNLTRVSSVERVFVAVSPDDPFIANIHLPERVSVVPTGGATRAQTVLNTLRAIARDYADDTLILVHDAARPLVEPSDVERLLDETRSITQDDPSGGCVLAMPVADTVKRTNEEGDFIEDVDRTRLVRVATPQCFRLAPLVAALSAHSDVTDESSAVRASGGRVRSVACSPMNFKVTVPEDRTLAQMLLAAQQQGTSRMKLRIGLGYDSHRLVEGRPFILGGVKIEHTLGLAGHSDADALLHAITDALLGAANCGNIGILFPDNDPAYKGADSAVLLKEAWARVRETGDWEITNIDAVVVAQKPKLNPHVGAMCTRIAALLGLDPSQVSVKPKTNEKLGYEGREEGITVHATVLLVQH
ncbi:MAG: 2-C-methyl-D-erythritol 2,4-cyclodiphosphate synthase [Duodenibacillus sp.]